MKYLLVAVLCVTPFTLFAQSQESCPAGTEDMLNYFTMGYPNRLSNYIGPRECEPDLHEHLTDLGYNFAVSGQFLWIKSAQGYPWDIKTLDGNYVYDRATEYNWNDPTSFKRFNADLPMAKRCVPVNKPGGSIKISSAGTNYTSYSNCQPVQTQDLGNVVNSISAPSMVDTGGNLGVVQTRYFTYAYSCSSRYKNCAYEEVYSVGYGVGLYDWKYYVNQGGSFVLQQESVINQFDSGSATPYLPCMTSYQ